MRDKERASEREEIACKKCRSCRQFYPLNISDTIFFPHGFSLFLFLANGRGPCFSAILNRKAYTAKGKKDRHICLKCDDVAPFEPMCHQYISLAGKRQGGMLAVGTVRFLESFDKMEPKDAWLIC